MSCNLAKTTQYLNDGMIKNNYPLPLVGDLVDKLQGAKWFTKLDIHGDITTYRSRKATNGKVPSKPIKGLFKPMVMFFSLCNSLATFQNMMNDIFWDRYMRDGLSFTWMISFIFLRRPEEYRKQTLWVLEDSGNMTYTSKWRSVSSTSRK